MEIKEKWKDIQGYEGLYQISNHGNVKSLNYNKTGKEKILKQGIDKDGYCLVGLTKEKKIKTHKVHRLVAQAFLPNPNNYPCVNHKDENKQNNIVSNLEFCDVAYNNSYGTHKYCKCKPIVQLTKSGLIIGVYDSSMNIERKLGIDNSCIRKCCNGERKTCGGFKWKYLDKLKKAG